MDERVRKSGERPGIAAETVAVVRGVDCNPSTIDRVPMITGAHWLLYTQDPEADRAFFRDVLGLKHVDVGGGWLIFKAPPSELACHPIEGESFVQRHAGRELIGAILYLMCDDLDAMLKKLLAKNIPASPADQAPWGRFAIITLPSGGKIGLYQPSHTVAYDL